MAADWNNPDDVEDDEDEYFSEVVGDYEPTGREPKFFRMTELDIASADLAQMRVDDLVLMYRKIRDQMGTESKAVKSRKERLKMQLGILGLLLRDRGDTLGVDSFTTPNGTAYRHRVEKMKIGDWDATVAYLKETGNFQILQKRVAPNSVKEIREIDGALPPGIESVEEVTFSVRSPTARKRS